MSENVSLTPQEVAGLLKISKNTVYELIKRGDLNGYRVGKKMRVDEDDVEAYKDKTRSISTLHVPVQESPLIDFDGPPLTEETSPGFVICGQDILLDMLARKLEEQTCRLRVLRSYLGSYNGLFALYRGDVQVATAHLWDAATDSYNLPYVKHMLPGMPADVFRLAKRIEGFYVAKGNPKGIHGWEDLKRHDLTIVNREKGSGARVLLDEHLKLLKKSGRELPGYERECTSHIMSASTVARGGADFGIGIEKAGMQVDNIEFIPLQQECFDLVIKKEDLSKPIFQSMIEIIRSSEFASELHAVGGYDVSEIGRLVGET